MREPLSYAQLYDALLSLLGERGIRAYQIGQRAGGKEGGQMPSEMTWQVGETIFLAEEFLPRELQEGLWSQFHLLYSRRYTAKRAAIAIWGVWRRDDHGGGEESFA